MSIPVIHQTDLFRPHNDPDDHWDLACVYALARAGDIELKGIVIDYPPPHHRGDPDVLALAQMNYLTSLHVPFSIGSPLATTSSGDHQARSLSDEGRAVRMIVETLKNASSPVVVHIAGSCRDVARAGIIFPELFREKCAGIYLNAGTGSRQTATDAELEYNVRLDPIEIQCDANGITTWSPVAASNERHISHVRDVKNYSRAMTTAMRSLLATLP